MDIPVLFITFSRPEYARLVFNQIKKAKPGKLYFYSNKGRDTMPDELARNEEIRNFIKEIDWSCDLCTFFRDSYVDIYTSLLSAIDWVFENEEQAIILEEDCLPSGAFFDFCRQLLPKFKDDIRIWLISGDNYYPEYNPNGFDYIFTRYPYQYGWATWQSRWKQLMRKDIPWEQMKEYDLYKQIFPDQKESKVRTEMDDKAYAYVQEHPCWDYLFGFTAKSQGGFGIIPAQNLVSNIGITGHHNSGYVSSIHQKAIMENDSYLIRNEPPFVIPDYKYDRYFFAHFESNSQNYLKLFCNFIRHICRNTLRLLNINNKLFIRL